MKKITLIAFLLVAPVIFLTVSLAQADIPATEREALIALYNSTNGASWNNNENWLGPVGSENTWHGIVIGNTHVTAIFLVSNNLVGTIPKELGNLTNLQELWLTFNQLTGSIPRELGNITDLQYLYLHSNQLTGSIPKELGNLTNLQRLVLNSNQLTGSIPLQLMNLTSLLDNQSDIRWNHLFTTDDDLRNFLNSKQVGGDWESYQSPPFTNAMPWIPLLLFDQ